MQRCCPPAEVVDTDFEPAAALLKAIADPYRLTILATLAASRDGVCVCDFTGAFPLNQPAVSHHVRILREAELVTSERIGTWVYYRLAPAARKRLSDALKLVFRQKVPA
ncbi:MAG TPA: metalloregulator ArsR/SmtB family transcription factor [Candidatus Cybelea sp.]|jgi:ArsR family transcriptional regulator|nr:metalloregulator ArsR/SmtB family transcription factor [Candidatus Cybelea sp.]